MDVWTESGGQLTLDKQQMLGSGVSGSVYPHPTIKSLCLKIYHSDDATENAPKVRAMLANVPNGIVDRNTGRNQAAWPLEVVRDAAGPVGFVMPRVDFVSTQSLTGVFNLAETDEISRKKLLVTAANIVSLVANMHRAGHHIIDFNPENFRIHKTSGVLTLVDCDGFQITDHEGHHLDAPAAWIDHVAPCYIGLDGSPNIVALNANGTYQDSWGCSVLVFRLLNRNILPFDGIPKRGMADFLPSENPARARDCSRLYPYGRMPSKVLNPLPISLHQTFPTSLRSAFDSCFADERPLNAVEWRILITKFLSSGHPCKQDANHFSLSTSCEQCASTISKFQPVVQQPGPTFTSPQVITTPAGTALPNASPNRFQGWFWLAGLGVLGLIILSQRVNGPGSTAELQPTVAPAGSAQSGPGNDIPQPAQPAVQPDGRINGGASQMAAGSPTAPDVQSPAPPDAAPSEIQSPSVTNGTPSPTLPQGGTVLAPALSESTWSDPVRIIPGYRLNSTLPNGGEAYAYCHEIATGNWVDCVGIQIANGYDFVHYKSIDPNNSVLVGYSYIFAN